MLYATWVILRASGVDLTDDLRDGIEAFILVLCGVPFVAGLLTRLFVYSPNSVRTEVDKAYEAGITGHTQPTL